MQLQGTTQRASDGDGLSVFTLPTGYRPLYNTITCVVTAYTVSDGFTHAVADVTTTGTVVMRNANLSGLVNYSFNIEFDLDS